MPSPLMFPSSSSGGTGSSGEDRPMAPGRASVPVQRAKVALRGGAHVSFLIFAASVHYPGRLKTRVLIPPSSSPPTNTTNPP